MGDEPLDSPSSLSRPTAGETKVIKNRIKSIQSLESYVKGVEDGGSTLPSPESLAKVDPRRVCLKTILEIMVIVVLICSLLLMGYVVAPQVSALALGCATMYRSVVDWNGLSGGVYMAFLADHAVMDGWMRDGVSGYQHPPHERGILVPAGGQNQLLNAFTNLHVLRNHLNCSLPVTIAYWGSIKKERIDKEAQNMFEKFIGGVSFLDLSTVTYPKHHRLLHIAMQNTKPSKYYGFKVKVFALYAAPYKQVLLMDSDSMALQNPEGLFKEASFVKHGNMFWPDRWCTRVEIFDKLSSLVIGKDGVHDPQSHHEEEQQTDSGQFLFDRERHSDVLEWLLFLNTHEEFTYRYAYGDKDTYKAAFLLSDKEGDYYQVEQRLSIGLRSSLFFKNNPQGFIQHHPNDNTLLFVHRTSKAKYAVSDEQGRNFDFMLIQPTCAWNQKYWHFFQPMLFFHNHVNHGSGNCSYHSSCKPMLVGEKDIPHNVQQCQYHADEAAQIYRELIIQIEDGITPNNDNVWHMYALVSTLGMLVLYVLRVVCF